MMFVLLVWLLVGLVEGKSNEINRPRQSNAEADHHSNLDSGPLCQNVVAYYAGTLRNKQQPNSRYTVQFQVQMNANQTDNRIHVVFDRWNHTLLSSDSFFFDFAYDDNDIQGDQIGTGYSGPFAFGPTNFVLTLNHATNKNWDNSIRIIYFSAFNNSFQLNNAIDQCTKKQLEVASKWNMDPSLIDYCVCCGDYRPSEKLGCPVNPWTPPKTAPISCQSVVGYYDGVFKNKILPDRAYPAQFQLRMTSDLAEQQYNLTIEGWNQTVSKSTDFSMDFYYRHADKWCNDLTVNQTCSAPFFNDDDVHFGADFDHGSRSHYNNNFHLFLFDPFNHTFVFDAAGKCTTTPPNYDDDFTPDRKLYNVCMCCDDYNPDPALDCPKSQWSN